MNNLKIEQRSFYHPPIIYKCCNSLVEMIKAIAYFRIFFIKTCLFFSYKKVEYYNTAKRLLKKNTHYKQEHFKEALEKSSSLAKQLYRHKRFLNESFEFKEKEIKKWLFEKTFKCFMELKLQNLSSEELKIVPLSHSKKLFGKNLFLLKVQETRTFISIQKEIGNGSYNVVYFAIDILNAKCRAIRLLNKTDARSLEKLKIENKLHDKLFKYPLLKNRIIKIVAMFSQQSFHGSLLAFADVGCLRDVMDKKHLKPSQKKKILQEVVYFISDLHEENFVFGDIKAENIFLKTCKKTGEIKVKFGDFGGVHHIITSVSGTLTPAYAAPEIIGNFKSTLESDCWALGILMFLMKYPPKLEEDAPEFVTESLKEINFFRDKSYLDIGRRQRAQESFKNLLNKPDRYFNAADPYDTLIIKLLKYQPEQRASAKELVKQIPFIPEEYF